MKIGFVVFSVVFLCIFFFSASGEKVGDIIPVSAQLKDLHPAMSVKIDMDFAKFPLYFISNRGQVSKEAAFYARASRYTLWLTKKGLVFDSVKKVEVEETHSPYSPHSQYSPEHLRDVSWLIFLNADKNPVMLPIDETKHRVNYLIGNDKSKWHCDIPTSQAVLYKNLYKKIDLKVYGVEEQIEYDWIVKPGGNPGDIGFEYQNVKSSRIDDKGNLLIETDFGELVHRKPVSYQYIGQKKVPVEAEFKKMAGNRFGFRVGDFDKNRELIIDPVVLAYSTYLGGCSSDFSYGIAADNNGNVYVTGYTLSDDFPTCNPYQTPPTGWWLCQKNVFVTKIDTTKSGAASLVYSTYIGGKSEDYGYGIAVDNNGCVYVTGGTNSIDFPILDHYQTHQGGFDVFISKIDTNLGGADSLVYSTYLGGWQDEKGLGTAVDNNGNVYLTGYTESCNFPTLNPYQPSPAIFNNKEAFVARIDTNLAGSAGLIYSTYLGGRYDDIGKGIAIDNSGSAYVTGYTESNDFPVLNQYQTGSWGWYRANVFITRIDTTRSGAESLIYSTCLGGYQDDKGYAIAVDNHGKAYVTGATYSNDFPTRNAYQADKGGWSSLYGDAFVAKIDTTKSGDDSLVYSTYLGSQSDDAGKGIAVNGSGEVYVAGYTKGCNFPVLDEFQDYQDCGYRSCNAFIAMIDTGQSGTAGLIYSTYLGGNGNDEAHGIALDSSGFVYITGNTESTNFPLVNQYMTSQYYPYEDVFITKLICSRIKVTSPNGGENWEVGSLQTITWTGQGPLANVRIEYSSDNGTTWTEIVPSTPNDGTHPWTVPDNVSPQCLVRISEIDGDLVDTSDAVFSIVPVPGITVTSPNGDENFEINSTRDIAWISIGIVGDVRIEYSVDNGVNWIEIVSSTENDGLYYWIIPDTISAQCLVRVSETDGSPADISDHVFSIVDIPGITVTYPNGGEELQVGSLQTINWTYTGIVGNVKIEYSTDNGDGWTEITPSTVNDGSYPWTIPNTLSDQCLVRISETGGDPSDTGDNVFSIVNIPTITVTSPNGGEEWLVGSQQTITWTYTGTVGNVKIEYSADNGGDWIVITSSTPNDGSHSWTVPDTVSSQCLIRVSETDGNPTDTGNNVFSIVPIPTVTVISPNGGEEWRVGSQKIITWTSTGTVGNVKIEYTTDNGTVWTGIVSSTANEGSYPWTVPDTISSQCLIRVSEIDGSPSDVSDSVFSIVPLPTITVISPNGTENWKVGSRHNITWTSTGSVINVIIEYTTDRGATWITIVASTPNDGVYNWTVPDNPSDQCFIRIRESDTDDGVMDVSNAEFSITSSPTGTVTVTSPNGGETLTAYSKFEITWATTGIVGDVIIEYSPDRGKNWIIIVSSTANNGSFGWTVPDTPSDNCIIRISESGADPGKKPSDVSDGVFTIVSPQSPTLLVTSPNGGENLIAGYDYNITWSYTGMVGNVSIEYSTDNGGTWKNIVASTANSGIYAWKIPKKTADNCLVRISETDGEPADVSDAVFSIVLPPSITITSPNGGESWEAGSFHDIAWTSTGNVDNLNIEYSIDNGITWIPIVSSTVNDGNFVWIVPDSPSDICLVRVIRSDADEIISDESDAVFSILPPLSPSVIITSPNGSETLEAGSIYEITWLSFGTAGNVTIEYSTTGGAPWTGITASTVNNGIFAWTVPDTPSDTCRIRVSETDGDPSDISDSVFSIFPASPAAVAVTSPNGGESLTPGSTHEITWTGTRNINNVIIEYSTDNGISWTGIAIAAFHDGSYYWPVPDTPSDSCFIRISGNDGDAGISDTNDEVFSIVSPLTGTITLISPNGGENLTAGTSYQITWTSTGAIDNVTLEYSIDRGTSWTTIVEFAVNNGNYDWIVPDTYSDYCLVRISRGDGDGIPADTSDDVFSIVSW